MMQKPTPLVLNAGAALCGVAAGVAFGVGGIVPLALGMLVLIFVAMTFGPSVVTVASRFGLLDPKRDMRVRGWRKVGAATVRWPGAILVASIAVSLIGLLALPGYQTSYNDRNYLPKDIESNVGYAAAERHFSPARLNPEVLMVESDQDLRNPADFIVIDRDIMTCDPSEILGTRVLRTVIDGEQSLEELGQRIFERILAIASGEQSKSEALGVGEEEFAPWPIGVTG